MWKRKAEEGQAVETGTPPPCVPLPEVPLATAFWVDGKLTWASIPAVPAREPHAGTCTCEACFAAWLADPGLKFY
jgi:hypothetical protein